MRPWETVDKMGVDAISSPVEAESEVRCKVYDLGDFSSPMRYIVVVVATISEMMNCVLKLAFSVDCVVGDDGNEPLVFCYPTPSNLTSIRSSNPADGMSIREDEHVWVVTVIRGCGDGGWKECDLDAEIGRI